MTKSERAKEIVTEHNTLGITWECGKERIYEVSWYMTNAMHPPPHTINSISMYFTKSLSDWNDDTLVSDNFSASETIAMRMDGMLRYIVCVCVWKSLEVLLLKWVWWHGFAPDQQCHCKTAFSDEINQFSCKLVGFLLPTETAYWTFIRIGVEKSIKSHSNICSYCT